MSDHMALSVHWSDDHMCSQVAIKARGHLIVDNADLAWTLAIGISPQPTSPE